MRCCSPALSFINIFIEWDKLLTFGDIMNGPGVLGRMGGPARDMTGNRPKGSCMICGVCIQQVTFNTAECSAALGNCVQLCFFSGRKGSVNI